MLSICPNSRSFAQFLVMWLQGDVELVLGLERVLGSWSPGCVKNVLGSSVVDPLHHWALLDALNDKDLGSSEYRLPEKGAHPLDEPPRPKPKSPKCARKCTARAGLSLASWQLLGAESPLS